MIRSKRGMVYLCRSTLLSGVLLVGQFAVAQCPGVRPRFAWASDGSSIVFTDQTDAFITERVWHFGDGDSANNDASVTHVYDTAAISTVSLTVVSLGCSFTISAPVVHGGVNDACTSQLSSQFTTEQVGNNHLVFSDQSQGDGSFLFYFWTFGDDSARFDQNTEHFYVSPGAYDVSHSIATVDSLFQTACVAGSAQRVFVDGNTSTCDSSLFLDLTIGEGMNPAPLDAQVVLFDQNLSVLDWMCDYGDGTSSVGTSFDNFHFYTYPGDYQMCVQVTATDQTTSDTCYARACATLAPPVVSISERSPAVELRARPVPFKDELWLEGPAVTRGTFWRIIDAVGKEVLSGAVQHNGTDRLDTDILPSGVYTLMLDAPQHRNTLRLSKQ